MPEAVKWSRRTPGAPLNAPLVPASTYHHGGDPVYGRDGNPGWAEATDMEITTNPDEDQRVVAEARAGYKLKDRIIRPARVKVAKYVAPAQA